MLPPRDLNPPTGAGTDQGETTEDSWQWFHLMHEAIGSRPSITPPVLIASCTGEDEPTTSTASCLPGPPQICEEDIPPYPSQSPSPPSPQEGTSSMQKEETSPPKKRRKDCLVEAMLKEGERDEARFRRLEAQTDRLLAIFEKMVDKM